MARSPEALLNPNLLVWARQKSGFAVEEAARKLRIRPDRLRLWESGEAHPTVKQARKVAHIYGRPLAVFYLAEPPRDFDVMKDYRRLPGTEPRSLSPGLLREIRSARFRREITIELASTSPGMAFRALGIINRDMSAEVAGSALRDALAISEKEQYEWRTSYDALTAWRTAVERLNVLVFQTSSYSGIDIAEMRGFSISDEFAPVIVLNVKDSPTGRIFTLLHELTHVALGHGGLCDLVERHHPMSEEQQTEVFCNHVAAATLVPRHLLLAHTTVGHHSGEEWTAEELSELSGCFRVSRETILRRLLTLGQADKREYRRWRSQFVREYEEISELPRQSFPVPYSRRVVARNGYAFTQTVLEAYYRDAVTARDVSVYLGTKLRHIPDIEMQVFGYTGGLGRTA